MGKEKNVNEKGIVQAAISLRPDGMAGPEFERFSKDLTALVVTLQASQKMEAVHGHHRQNPDRYVLRFIDKKRAHTPRAFWVMHMPRYRGGGVFVGIEQALQGAYPDFGNQHKTIAEALVFFRGVV